MHGQPYQPVPYQPARIPAKASMAISADLRERMSERRTVRTFATDPVPEQVVLDAIAVAATAPSGANQQPWTYVLVTSPQTRAAIRTAVEEDEQRSYEGRLGQEWLAARVPLGTDAHKPHLTDAPYLIAVFEQQFYLDANGASHKHYHVDESVGISVGMLLTTLHLSGLSALVHAPNSMDFLSDMLCRPHNEKPFAVIAVGYPARDAVVPDLVRKSLDEVIIRA
ncbi:nitroreductase family protein [Kibdelosporangium persicum]|uniref:NADH dehydrogenase n=1 Tax=Kibdelosporangium persicum TaxID=2698649 RepID=A0ABX2F6G8_9PSEU|nr:nitroreductase family protein [Kibdelosporangium persicum]NRN66749.1 NADH dehydrogenase [Kibdelosporangium persicum]